ncbi:MAG: pilus assembly protein PilM [Clostridiales bacterium]|nr:pilus assembly protein PilM [Clostridiales bacterium]MCF8021138.1 pilus assembly protein PilM [Clostridiales bacterium]
MLSKLKSKLFIDIRGKTVRVIQGRPARNSLSIIIDSYGELVLPHSMETPLDKGIAAACSRYLKKFLQKKNISAGKAAVSLGVNGIITRNVNVPKMKYKDLKSMMDLEINEYLPVNCEEYLFDYKVVSEFIEDGKEYLDILVAAVKREQAEQSVFLLEKAGIKPQVIDILPNLFYRLFNSTIYQDTMVLDGGVDGTHLVIFKDKEIFMYADIPYVIDEHSDLSALAREMSGYMDYFSSRNFGKSLDEIFILGELAGVAGLKEVLSQYFSIPIIVGLPGAEYFNFQGKAAGFSESVGLYAGNLGLMLRDSKYKEPVNNAASQPSETLSGIPAGN